MNISPFSAIQRQCQNNSVMCRCHWVPDTPDKALASAVFDGAEQQPLSRPPPGSLVWGMKAISWPCHYTGIMKEMFLPAT